MPGLPSLLRSAAHDVIANRRGTAAIEFAFIAPLLIMLTVGMIDLGRLYFAASSFKHGASEAARLASIRGADSIAPVAEEDVISFLQKSMAGVHPDTYEASVIWDPDNKAGSRVTVKVDYHFKFFIGGFLPLASLDLTRSSTMVVL